MANKTDNTESDKLNPSARDYEDSFSKSLSAPNTPADLAAQDQRDAAMRNSNASTSVANAEKQAIGDTAVGKVATAAAGAAGGTIGSTAAKFIGKIKTKKGGGIAGAVIALILVIIAVMLIAPSALLISLKENGGKWLNRTSNVGMHKRVRDVMEKRYFSDPADCKGIKVKCRFTPGLSEAEITKLKNAGLIQDTDISTKDGKKFLKQMTFTGKDGVKSIVTKNTFRSFYGSHIDFNSRLSSIVDSGSILTRGKAALKKYSGLDIRRSNPLGDEGDEKTRLKNYRESFYGDDSTRLKADVDSETKDQYTDEQLKQLTGDIEGVNEEAEKLRANALTNGPGTLIPDTNILSIVDPSKVAFSGLKGAIGGFFASVDSACTVYNTIRIANFAAKVYAARALMKYAGLFLTIADKQKVNKVSTAEVSLLARTLLRPSTVAGSKGKDFSQSQGFNLIMYGKITNPESLARYTNGTTGMQALNSVYSAFNFGSLGISAEFCQKVLSWWGQLLISFAGVVTSIGTLGAGAIVGTTIGLTKSLALGYITQVLIKKLVPIVAGTVAPDLATDPEGGYGAGNAFASGAGALGGVLGRGVGMRPLTKSQLHTLSQSDSAKLVAITDRYTENQRGVFDFDNPQSIQNTLALQLSPLVNYQQSFATYISNLGTVISNAFSSPLQVAYAAENLSIEASIAGEHCAEGNDPFINEDPQLREFARDANCNIQYGAEPTTISDINTRDGNTPTSDGKYSIDTVTTYMLDNGYVDADGNATDKGATGGNETSYATYVRSCPDDNTPPSKFSADLGDDLNPALCYGPEEYKLYFDTYTQLTNTAGGADDAATDKLGYADESTAATSPTSSETTDPTTPTNVGGMIWPISKADYPKGATPISECVPMYKLTPGRIGDVHTGIDIMVPTGTKVYAVTDGKVVYSSSIYGMVHMQTNLKDGSLPLYANYQHLSRRLVGVGDIVKQGQVIGYSGSTGTTIQHLHFGVWTSSGILSGNRSYDDPRATSTLDKMRHPLNYLPEDGRNVANCKKPYVI
jgi:murein DD-endopeptidase MepM/ murein hydrolase activator NlpD